MSEPNSKPNARAMNTMNEETEFSSILKSAVAKIDPRIRLEDREFREIVNECVQSLDDDLRSLIRLNPCDSLSERKVAARLRMHVSSGHRRLEKAEPLLEPLLEQGLEDRGIAGPEPVRDRPSTSGEAFGA